MLKRRVARWLWRLTGWKITGEPPGPDESAILVGAPHTSNWDYVIMLLVVWQCDFPVRFLVKKEAFRGPIGWLMRKTGGIAVDRENPGGLARALVAQAEAAVRNGESFILIVTPEGTRKRTEHWKSGFYRIARDTGLPLLLGYIDRPSHSAGFGPRIKLTGEARADMDQVRAFYADKHGVRPALRTEPRLREESSAG